MEPAYCFFRSQGQKWHDEGFGARDTDADAISQPVAVVEPKLESYVILGHMFDPWANGLPWKMIWLLIGHRPSGY